MRPRTGARWRRNSLRAAIVGESRIQLVHVVNTCAFDHAPDLARAQSVTVESMRRARDYARDHGVVVRQVGVAYPEDRDSIPSDFLPAQPLTGSIREDVPAARRKLPRIAEVLSRGIDGVPATHAVYTNVDIGLVPHFYVAVAAMLRAGDRSLVINRRTIPDFKERSTLPPVEVLSSFVGDRHPGRDCFVFPVDSLAQFELGRTVIGASGIGRVLQWNLEAACGPVTWRKDLHLTFHLGNDEDWRETAHDLTNQFNRSQVIAVYDRLVAAFGPFARFTEHPSDQPV